jgi:tRNA threonylcarbamoyladenosine modification (KEOPS) complex Cgi121 subunit
MRVYSLKCRRTIGKEIIEEYRDLQVIDSMYVAGKEHLEFALAQAEKAFQRKTNISKDPLMEVIVRASAQRQIKKALETYGVQNSKSVYVLGEELPRELLDDYGCVEAELGIDENKYEDLVDKFEVTEEEIGAITGASFNERVKALKEIIKERIALLETM